MRPRGGVAVVIYGADDDESRSHSEAEGQHDFSTLRRVQQKDLAEADGVLAGRVRRAGGGRKPLVVSNPDLLRDLMALVEPGARGDPMSPLRWTCKSLRRLAAELAARGHRVSRTVVGELLKAQKFSLQANSKTNEGGDRPDRDAQFSHINLSVTAALAAQEPVISVDTKKKELVGDFKNAGREWRPQGQPEAVRVHDFLIKELGRAGAVRHLRPGRQRRLGQCRHEP